MLILIPSRIHNTSWQHKYKNTIIKKEGNRIHLDKSQDQSLEYKTQSYSTLEIIQKLFENLKTVFDWSSHFVKA